MTREDIERMEAGREMDALIAEKVMGWKKVSSLPWKGSLVIVCHICDWYWLTPQSTYECSNDNAHGWLPPHFSTDIAAAWQVVEKIDRDGYCSIFKRGAYWHASFFYNSESFAETAPLAICRAALIAKMRV